MLHSLRARLFGLVLVTSLPAIAIQAFNEFELRRERTAELHAQALTQARLAASDLGRVLEGARQTMVAISNFDAVRALEPVACGKQLQELQPLYPAYLAITVFDLQDRIVCSSFGPIAVNIAIDDATRTLDANARRMGFQVGFYRLGMITGKRALPMAYPVVQEGRVVGNLQVTLGLDWLADELQRITHEAGVSLSVSDRNFTILGRVPEVPGAAGTKLGFDAAANATRDGTIDRIGLDGIRRVYAFVPNDPRLYGLTVVLGIERDPAFAQIDQSTLRGVLLILAGLASALGLAALIARRLLTEPIERLAATAREWGEGALDRRVESAGTSEFADLARAFNLMAARVEETVQRQDMLLREVDHRVMNSFQLLSSLLALQRRSAKDPAIVRELRMVEQRVHALALVHTRLHRSGGFTDVDVGPYLTELARDLGSSLLPQTAQNQLVVDAIHAVLPVQSATALGMIAAELITNAAKHAGIQNPATKIRLTFQRTETGRLRLSVHDNGGGLPPDFDPALSGGLGMRLVQVLTRQLGAQFTWRSDESGTEFNLDLGPG
ncbi:MAG: histidine kinase [Rhodospirillales bacterium]|jgi:two-component sensor histidine kinase|nr:histidine kinase [Rhodospirillales bacterium]